MLGKIRERDVARERAAVLRAAFIAAEIHNAHRVNARGVRIFYKDAMKPADFLPKSEQPVQYVDGEELRSIVRGWIGKRSH